MYALPVVYRPKLARGDLDWFARRIAPNMSDLYVVCSISNARYQMADYAEVFLQ